MKPYKVKFILDDKIDDHFYFESIEKPFKGEIFTLQDTTGKLVDIKITEMTKYLIKKEDYRAEVEYICKVEEHKASNSSIGFNKS